MKEGMMGTIRDIIVAVLVGFFTIAGGYIGFKVGSTYGYMKGVSVKLNPFKRDKDDGNRLIPFWPGDIQPDIGSIPEDETITIIDDPSS